MPRTVSTAHQQPLTAPSHIDLFAAAFVVMITKTVHPKTGHRCILRCVFICTNILLGISRDAAGLSRTYWQW